MYEKPLCRILAERFAFFTVSPFFTPQRLLSSISFCLLSAPIISRILGSPLSVHLRPSKLKVLIKSDIIALNFFIASLPFLFTTFYRGNRKYKTVNNCSLGKFRSNRTHLTNKCPILSVVFFCGQVYTILREGWLL